MNSDRKLWDGVLSRIIEAMNNRKATEAVIYLMDCQQAAHFQPFKPTDKEAAAEYLAAAFSVDEDVKYLAVVFILGCEGKRRFSEFYPITPRMGWPNHIVQEIVERAIGAAGYKETTLEGSLVKLDTKGIQ